MSASYNRQSARKGVLKRMALAQRAQLQGRPASFTGRKAKAAYTRKKAYAAAKARYHY